MASSKSTPDPQELQQFTPFGGLPFEIRKMIWEQTIHPRDVVINNYNPRPDTGPATLHACKESFLATVSSYKHVYQGNHCSDKTLSYWIDFSTNHISYQPTSSPTHLLSFEECISAFLEDMELHLSPWWIKHTRKLRVTVDPDSSLLQSYSHTWRLLKKSCPDLQQVSILVPIISGRELSGTSMFNPLSRARDILNQRTAEWAKQGKQCTAFEMILVDVGEAAPKVDFEPSVWIPVLGGSI